MGVGGALASEVYSPPRVTEHLRTLGLPAGAAFGLTTFDEHGEEWGFTKAERRAEARRGIEEGNPMGVGRLPDVQGVPCTYKHLEE